MTKPEQVSAEARRALAEDIERLISGLPDDIEGAKVFGAYQRNEWLTILAALRAQPDRGAEEMRERAADAAQDERVWMPYWEGQGIPDAIAAAIRALPLEEEAGE